MSRARKAVRELLGLFIDDRVLGLAIVMWLAVVGLLLPRLGLDPRWISLALFIGCTAILTGSTALAARRSRLRASIGHGERGGPSIASQG
jgi:hypothetical protein